MKLMEDHELITWVSLISEKFYEMVYEDPWFSKIFRNVDQKVITSQQADFMIGNLGGPKKFGGRMPKDAHPQIWIDEHIWQYREKLLLEAFDKVNAPKELQARWLKIDEAFKQVIINKGDKSECFGRYKTDEIIYEPIPDHLKEKKAG